MFDIGSSEFLLVLLVALVVIGPKDLPRVLRTVGKWMAKARNIMAQFRSGIDDMVRDSELKDMEKQWKEQNDAIMRDFPAPDLAAGSGPKSEAGSDKPDVKTEPELPLAAKPDADKK